MNRRIASVLLLTVALLALSALPAMAGTSRMLFWYPGEAGSTAEAKPVLDAFFAYVNPKIAPEALSGSYLNSVEGGSASLLKERPAVAIISFAAASQHPEALAGARPLLATLPLPGGAATERYTLVGTRANFRPGEKLLASEPLSATFVREKLFASLPADASVTHSDQLLLQLKKMGDGALDAIAILTPSEAASLKAVSAAWAQNLKVIGTSAPVPSARVWLLDPTWKGAEKFTAALLAAGSDPAARELLNEMRLKGFVAVP